MNQKIDYKMLLEQEPEVAAFFKDVLLEIMSSDPEFPLMAKPIYSFYQSGIPALEVAKILKFWKNQ